MDQPVNHQLTSHHRIWRDRLFVLAMQNITSRIFVLISRKITNLHSLPYVRLSVLKLCQNPWSREEVERTRNENG